MNKYATSRVIMLAILGVTLMGSSAAQALQFKDGTDHAQITAKVSAKEISRISLTHDRIRMVNNDPQVSITHDGTSGDIYIKPALTSLDKPLNLFITSELGFTYQLLLVPQDIPSEQIIIRNEATELNRAEALQWEAEAPFHSTVTSLLKSIMGLSPAPKGYKDLTPSDKQTRRIGDLTSTNNRTLQGSLFQATAITLFNTNSDPVQVDEATVYAPDHIAFYTPKRKLNSNESVTVYVIQYRHKQSQGGQRP